MKDRYVVGIDIGGTKVAGVLVRQGASDSLREVRRELDAAPLVDQVTAVVGELLHAGDGMVTAPAAIGVVVPGQVDRARGVVRMAVNLPDRREQEIGALVGAAVGAPCFVEHDARAVAAWLRDSGAGDDLAFLSVGTGVSAGIVLRGAVVEGVDGLAGEIGHAVADPAGPICPCGLRGCLEAVASGPAIARAADAALAAGRSSALRRGAPAPEIFALAGSDELATEVVTAAAGHLARAARGLALAFGVTQIVIGGGVARAGDRLIVPLEAALAAERAASPLVARAIPERSIRLLDDTRAGARAAAAVALRGLAADASVEEVTAR